MSIYYVPGAQLGALIGCFVAIVIVGIEKITNPGDNKEANYDLNLNPVMLARAITLRRTGA